MYMYVCYSLPSRVDCFLTLFVTYNQQKVLVIYHKLHSLPSTTDVSGNVTSVLEIISLAVRG